MNASFRLTAFLFLIALSCLCPSGIAATNSADTLAVSINSMLEDWNTPGVAVAVIKDGERVMVRGFGSRRVESNLPVTAETRFSIGSCTKAFTAAALGILVDQQLLEWDEPVVRHLHGFEMPDPSDTGRVTVRDLLAHKTGLSGGDLISWGSTFSRQELVERIRFLEPVYSLRSVFLYNNNVFAATSEVALAASGKTWDELVITGLLEPSGMTSTTTTIRDIADDADRASPHAYVENRLAPIPPINEDNIAASGSIWSTATDMTRWMQMLLDHGMVGDRRILSEHVIEDMWNLEMPVLLEEEWHEWPEKARPHFHGYGFGWNMYDTRGLKIISHEGMSDGMVASVTLVPEENLGIVVLANRHETNIVRPVTLMLLEYFTGIEPATDWNRLYLDLEDKDRESSKEPALETPSAPGPSRPSLDLAQYAGTYKNPAIGTSTLRLVENTLYIDFDRTPLYSATLEHSDADVFLAHRDYALVDSSPITFDVDASTGTVTGFTLVPDASQWLAVIDYHFERQPDSNP